MSTNPKGYMKAYFAKDGNYRKYLGTKKAVVERAKRNAARKKMGLKKGDPREIDHKNGSPTDNSRSNLRPISRTLNRKLGGASKKRTDGKLG